MENHPNEEDLKNIAEQLSCPQGEHGIKTGEMMSVSNTGMISAAIDAMNLQFNDYILEIGPGNGSHVAHLFTKQKELVYIGIDVSETMVAEATKNTKKLMENNHVYFHKVDGKIIPLITEQFDKIFTVNTIYFWEEPITYLREIKRVLNAKGLLVICFADKEFMQKLPFTKYRFKLYDLEEVLDLLTAVGFSIKNTLRKTEQIKNHVGVLVPRNYHVVIAEQKQLGRM